MPLFKPNIANLKSKRDVNGLVQALTIRDPEIRHDAAQALGELNATHAIPAIVKMLLADDSARGERIAAANALCKIGDEANIGSLVQANDASRRREHATIDAALVSPDPRYRANLYINRIAAEEYEVRAALAHAVGQIGGASAIQALSEMLITENGAMESSVKNEIRAGIAAAAQKPGALAALCQMIKHASSEVRYWAAHCLGDLNDAASVDALLRAAYDENESFDVRQIALMGLGKIGDERVMPYLEDLMHDPNPGVARSAMQCASAVRARRNPASRASD